MARVIIDLDVDDEVYLEYGEGILDFLIGDFIESLKHEGVDVRTDILTEQQISNTNNVTTVIDVSHVYVKVKSKKKIF